MMMIMLMRIMRMTLAMAMRVMNGDDDGDDDDDDDDDDDARHADDNDDDNDDDAPHADARPQLHGNAPSQSDQPPVPTSAKFQNPAQMEPILSRTKYNLRPNPPRNQKYFQ